MLVFPIALFILTDSLPITGAQVPITEERLQVRLVELDVRVLDLAGNPVSGLGPDDFTVIDNGKQRAIDSFEEVILEKLVPRERAYYQPRIMLLLDMVSTPYRDGHLLFDQLHEFVDHHRSQGTEVGLAVQGDGVELIREFTTSAYDLRSGIETARSLYGRGRDNSRARIIRGSSLDGVSAPSMKQRESRLRALQQFVTYVGAYHGNKNLIVISSLWGSGSSGVLTGLELKTLKAIQTVGLFGKVSISLVGIRRQNEAIQENLQCTMRLMSRSLSDVDVQGGHPAQKSPVDLTGGFFAVPARSRLGAATQDIIEKNGKYYRIRYYAESDDRGYRPVRVIANGIGRIAYTSGGYYGPAIEDLTDQIPIEKQVRSPRRLEVDMPTDWLTWQPIALRNYQTTVIVSQRAFDKTGALLKETVTTSTLTKKGHRTEQRFQRTLDFKGSESEIDRMEAVIIDMATGRRIVLGNPFPRENHTAPSEQRSPPR